MKNGITFMIRILGTLASFIGGMLIATLIVPTIALSQSSPSVVNLRTSGDFIILAKSGITTTGVTHITGDLGVSPIKATAITGFGLIMDASGTFSTSSLITGKVYASDYGVPTPTKLTTSVNDMNTAYNDAAGRLLPDYTELYTGDLTGQTLTHGLYKWGTNVSVAAGGVTISGSATDVWIFQIAQNLVLSSGAIVHLTGGANASNIFWQVAGQVNLGTTSQMKGIILCKTQIAMNTSATLNGRALAQTDVTLIANTLTLPDLALPVELMSFTSTTKGSSVVLIWSTSTEVNNRGFDVERSANNSEWSKLEFVAGSGTGISVRNYSYTDNSITRSGKYYFRLKQIDNDGSFKYSQVVETEVASPNNFMLSQNYPNPFNPNTVILYSLSLASEVKLIVYNSLGQTVKVLENGFKNAGSYSVSFNATELSSGTYFYKIEAGQFSQIKKMMLLK